MKIYIMIFMLLSCITSQLFAQDLLSERIRKLTPRKKAIFLESGIFHNGASANSSALKGIRHSFSDRDQYERVVLDFTTGTLPKLYGYIASRKKKIYLDLFKTEISSTVGSFGESKFIDSINFFPVTKDTLSVEIELKENVSVDIFYLDKPGRLVIDIKS